MLATFVQRARTQADHPGHSTLVAKSLADLLRPFEEWERPVGPGPNRSGFASLLEHRRPIRFAFGDLKRLFEERHGLERRPEGDGPICRGPQRDPRLARERFGLGAVGRGPMRCQVMGRQRAGKLVVAERLEVARRREVSAAPVAQREGRVGDLADDGLDERVLASLRRSRIDLTVEEVGSDQGAQPLLEDIGFEAAHRGQRRGRERLSEHGRVLDEHPVLGREGVEPRRDQRVEGLRDREVAQLPRRFEPAVVALDEPAVGDQHPDRLDRIQRDALGTRHDRADRRLGQAADEPTQQLAHAFVVERLQVEGEEVAAAGAPAGPVVEQLRAGQRHDEDRDVEAPVEHVVDEVEHARVGPVEVLEEQRDRAVAGDSLEVRPPRGEHPLRAAFGRITDPEQGEEGGFDPAGLVLVGDEALDRGGDLRSRGLLVIGFEQVGPGADHLAEGPEGKPLPVRRGAAFVPEDGVDDAVDVFQELPREAALANAGLPGDRHEPNPAVAGRGVEQVLEEPQLGVAADERGLEAVLAAAATALRNDPYGPPGRYGSGLALEVLLVDRFERNRDAGRPLGGLADQHGAGRRGGLQTGRGVDEVARHHPLTSRAERHGGLAGQDPSPCLEPRTQPMDGVDELERGSDRSLGIVLVGDGRAPQGHDSVADEFLDDPTVALDHLAREIEIARQQLADVLGVAALGHRGEADEVGEEDRDESSLGDAGFIAGGGRRQAGEAGEAGCRFRPVGGCCRTPRRSGRRACFLTRMRDRRRPGESRTRHRIFDPARSPSRRMNRSKTAPSSPREAQE